MKSFCSFSRTLAWLSLSCLTAAAHAQTGAAGQQHSLEAEFAARAQARDQARQEIALQRQKIESNLSEAEKSCWQRFAVENCLRSVRSQAREQDHVLRERELRINGEEREDKAAARMREIERKQAEQQLPAPLQVTPRKPLVKPVQPAPLKTPEEQEREQAQRDSEASERAAQQAQRISKHQAEMAEREASEAQRRERAKKAQLQKQLQAQQRRDQKASEIANRKGAPLPIPEGLPQP